MKAMILAAGLGKRMRPLTTVRPKPLLKVNGKALIDYHLERLAAAAITEVVINHYWLGEQIEAHIGDGSGYGLKVVYSREADLLDTAGGMINALPLLGDKPFLLVNGDVWCDFPVASLVTRQPAGAHLVMVDNPEHNPQGDFALNGEHLALSGKRALTYAGIAVVNPALFAGADPGCLPLKPFLVKAIERGEVTGEHYDGEWVDVGTPERLSELDARVSAIPA
ncbi:MurNAc alpha-1-phosphate uridylyltransferase [Litorivivens lipolytica]|uniref:MurNAc alpha-1-phosphate uridylyltransferase n=1 Tax=Litorivivens lipolytica TaxID=1524264 RepID=A0A7W4W743_9GAMM|nr:nucleotidyltransferase family protein [Litorivivens lipolytica]MBB3048134.1 MurNAc alpha-1-phosphate uridylyltransferase [Litorivivens lipolytica]